MDSCFKTGEFTLETTEMKKICKYHKRKGQEYRSNDVVRDFCADAFYVAYPYCLALLYGADKKEFRGGKVRLSCPNPRGIDLEVARIHCRPFPVRIAKRIFEWVVAKVLYPLDWEDWHIRIQVLENRGGCPANYGAGKIYWFNVKKLDELCPASFHGIYPVLLPYLLDSDLPWQSQGEPAKIHCPDHEGMVYSVKKEELHT